MFAWTEFHKTQGNTERELYDAISSTRGIVLLIQARPHTIELRTGTETVFTWLFLDTTQIFDIINVGRRESLSGED